MRATSKTLCTNRAVLSVDKDTRAYCAGASTFEVKEVIATGAAKVIVPVPLRPALFSRVRILLLLTLMFAVVQRGTVSDPLEALIGGKIKCSAQGDRRSENYYCWHWRQTCLYRSSSTILRRLKHYSG